MMSAMFVNLHQLSVVSKAWWMRRAAPANRPPLVVHLQTVLFAVNGQ
jgi:hypothetical protein